MVTPQFRHEEAGTAEQAWQEWDDPGLGALDRLELPGPPLVLAAHPDDETLGAGGLVAHAARLGHRPRIAVASAGEASHPASPTHPPRRLARVRRREVVAAVARLGGGRPWLLGLPDGGLAGRARDLDAGVADAVRARRPAVVVAPWRGDAHPDHEAVGVSAARLAARLGVPLWEYPVWTWHWGRPGDPRLPWDRTGRLDLSPDVVAAKAAAMAEHVSQTRPLSPAPGDEALLHPGFLAHFERPFEVFVVTPGEEAA